MDDKTNMHNVVLVQTSVGIIIDTFATRKKKKKIISLASRMHRIIKKKLNYHSMILHVRVILMAIYIGPIVCNLKIYIIYMMVII